MIYKTYTTIVTTEDVTQEVLDMAWSVIEGWFDSGDKKIDWESVWDRMEGYPLGDGTVVDMGGEFDSPAMRKIQREMRKIIRYG